jgi:hypothetical protein
VTGSRKDKILYGCCLTSIYARVVVSCVPGDRVLIVLWLWLVLGVGLTLWVAVFFGEAS